MHQDNVVSTVIVFDIDDADEQGFRAWLTAHQDNGYIGNIPRKNAKDDLILHTATCTTWTAEKLSERPFVCEEYYKVCATDFIDLLNWIHHHGPSQFRISHRCKKCHPILRLHSSQFLLEEIK